MLINLRVGMESVAPVQAKRWERSEVEFDSFTLENRPTSLARSHTIAMIL